MRSAELPRAAQPFAGFAHSLRRHGFSVAPEQSLAFMQAVSLLGPKSMADIHVAALATRSNTKLIIFDIA